MVEENPMGAILLLVFIAIVLLTYVVVKALLEEYKERQDELKRRMYEQGVADEAFRQEQMALEHQYIIQQARERIKKETLGYHDLSGCRKELALPAPQL